MRTRKSCSPSPRPPCRAWRDISPSADGCRRGTPIDALHRRLTSLQGRANGELLGYALALEEVATREDRTQALTPLLARVEATAPDDGSRRTEPQTQRSPSRGTMLPGEQESCCGTHVGPLEAGYGSVAVLDRMRCLE